MLVKLIKFENYYKSPERAHFNDSGADVFSSTDIVIAPHEVQKVPLGLGVELPDGYDAIINCKSGLSSKGIWAANAPIDSGYRGEIHAILMNLNNEPYEIKKGDKVGQLVVRPVLYVNYVDELGKERADGAFGSTGK